MRILQLFGLFVIFWQNQSTLINSEMDIARICNSLEHKTPILRLKRHLFCDYDRITRPNDFKTVTNVTLQLIPKLMDFLGRAEILRLHMWMVLSWTDMHLTWTPSDYDDITFIHVNSLEIWMPDLCVFNSGDMVYDQYKLPPTECVLLNTGSVSCVPALRYISKCNTDLTYWPYDTQQCNVSLGSWSYTGEEVNFLIKGNGVNMNDYVHSMEWDFKLIDSVKQVRKFKCCPNETYPKIDFMFSLSRHYGMDHISNVISMIVLMLLTVTVFWLDAKSLERLAIACVNFVCHIMYKYDLRWSLPYDGIKPANIMLFFRDSWGLATFALILTVVLRKLQDISMEMPNWISSATAFVLSNRAGRFLILTEEESRTVDEDSTNKNLDVPESGMTTKKWSWKYFVVIVDWLSLFCVIFAYVIMLIVFVPVG